MKHKSYIDAKVAQALDMGSVRKSRLVNAITTEFINQIRLLLAEQGTINVDGLGRFGVSKVGKSRKVKLTNGTGRPGGRRGTRTVDVGRGIRVYFRKSAALKKLLEETEHVR